MVVGLSNCLYAKSKKRGGKFGMALFQVSLIFYSSVYVDNNSRKQKSGENREGLTLHIINFIM